MLDIFFLHNKDFDRQYTEFGGWKGLSHGGFLPTGETVSFILAGEDIEKRKEVLRLFGRDVYKRQLHSMAALLDSPTVRQLMQTEMKEHAEVDLPPYWHYLYEWLIQYYPFNGLAMFGGKDVYKRKDTGGRDRYP